MPKLTVCRRLWPTWASYHETGALLSVRSLTKMSLSGWLVGPAVLCSVRDEVSPGKSRDDENREAGGWWLRQTDGSYMFTGSSHGDVRTESVSIPGRYGLSHRWRKSRYKTLHSSWKKSWARHDLSQSQRAYEVHYLSSMTFMLTVIHGRLLFYHVPYCIGQTVVSNTWELSSGGWLHRTFNIHTLWITH